MTEMVGLVYRTIKQTHPGRKKNIFSGFFNPFGQKTPTLLFKTAKIHLFGKNNLITVRLLCIGDNSPQKVDFIELKESFLTLNWIE